MIRVFSVLFGAAWLFAAMPGLPHHSFAAVFDVARPVEFTGTITRIDWTNPHAWIHMDVEGAEGNVENWSVELLGINTLLKQGWRPETAKPGDAVQRDRVRRQGRQYYRKRVLGHHGGNG